MTTGRINQVCQLLPKRTQPRGLPQLCADQQQKCDCSNQATTGPRSSRPCKSKMNSLLDAAWPTRGAGETRPPDWRPAALARRSVQDTSSRSTHRESTATTHIERRADSPEGCRAARSDSFRGPSPLKPRFISHSQSQRTTNE